MNKYLNHVEQAYYARQVNLPEIGEDGQLKLKQSRVLCVGAGGLGSPALIYLASAGIGTIGIVDFDQVEISNLHRQILYSIDDVGKSKAFAAKSRLIKLNPHINVIAYNEALSHENALNLIAEYDIVVDGSDNFATRYLVNDACFHLNKPFLHASISQFMGQCSLFFPPKGACYRCIYRAPLPVEFRMNCADAGVLGVLPGVMGAILANEVIKWVCSIGTSLMHKWLVFDALKMQFLELHYNKNIDCQLCCNQTTFEELAKDHFSSICFHHQTISSRELKDLFVSNQTFQLVDVRTYQEHSLDYIYGDKVIPLHELMERWGELDPDQLTILYCAQGMRSSEGVAKLQALGFKNVKSLTGGLHAWNNK